MEVIFIRHTSVDVPPGVCYGQSDVPLRDSFSQEAAVTSENLKSYRPEGRTMYIPVLYPVACVLPPIVAILMPNGITVSWKSTSAIGK